MREDAEERIAGETASMHEAVFDAIAEERAERERRGEEVRRRQEKQLEALREALEHEKRARAQSRRASTSPR